jgi:hypothetical protein
LGNSRLSNLKGNAYRLITEINYKTGKIFTRRVLTHADYSKGGNYEHANRKSGLPALLRKVSPKVIRTEKENEAYTEILCDLDRRSKSLSQAEKELADLLTLLIEDFEEKRYQLPRSQSLLTYCAF